MAPPRLIVRQQLEILIEFLEKNRDVTRGTPKGSTWACKNSKQKWDCLAKKLNAVPKGAIKSPVDWKKYWFEWRHRCRKKAANAQRPRSMSDGPSRFIPLNDLEIRALELNGEGNVTATSLSSKPFDDSSAEDSDSEPLETIKVREASAPRSPADACREPLNSRSDTPPPKWLLRYEERRLAAEERMADALTSIASIMKAQEERRDGLEERISDTLCSIAGSMKELRDGAQRFFLGRLDQLHTEIVNEKEDLKSVVFL